MEVMDFSKCILLAFLATVSEGAFFLTPTAPIIGKIALEFGAFILGASIATQDPKGHCDTVTNDVHETRNILIVLVIYQKRLKIRLTQFLKKINFNFSRLSA